jgi:type IV secretion system protein VirB9
MEATARQCCAGMLLALLLIAGAGEGAADEVPRVGPADPAVRTAAYNEWQVYELRGAYRAAMAVEFGVGETIENVGIGDSAAWDFSHYQNLLFLKPRQKAPPTNAIVQTTTKDGRLRLYNFKLSATDAPAAEMVKVKFVYPGDLADDRRVAERKRLENEAAERVAAESQSAIYSGPRNWAYTVAGATPFVPNETWDNGRATAFRFPGQTDLPAIYAVDSDGSERLAPSHTQDNLVVVHEVAAKWRVRSGAEVICIYNEDFRPGWGPERGNGSGSESWWRKILGSNE